MARHPSRNFRTPFVWLCILAVCAGGAPSARASDAALATHLTALASTLGPRERATLSQIPQLDRRLLALRAYVRAGSNLVTRWSWTEEQIRQYVRSDEHRRLLEEIDRVRAEFQRRNPGYELYANTQVRSLDVQLERWNANPGVGKTAANLKAAAQSMLSSAPALPSPISVGRFKRFLASWRPTPVAPLAAPGLSAHGRMRAVDFAIMRDGRFVAATNVGAVATQWEATGWDRRLKEAIVASGTQFKGPLKSPNEPWHYEYTGAAAETAQNAIQGAVTTRVSRIGAATAVVAPFLRLHSAPAVPPDFAPRLA